MQDCLINTFQSLTGTCSVINIWAKLIPIQRELIVQEMDSMMQERRGHRDTPQELDAFLVFLRGRVREGEMITMTWKFRGALEKVKCRLVDRQVVANKRAIQRGSLTMAKGLSGDLWRQINFSRKEAMGVTAEEKSEDQTAESTGQRLRLLKVIQKSIISN